MNEYLPIIATGISLLSALGVIYLGLRRLGAQNLSDAGSALKALQETADLAAAARLLAEKEKQKVLAEFSEREAKWEAKIEELEAIIEGSSFEINIQVRDFSNPVIERMLIRRIPDMPKEAVKP